MVFFQPVKSVVVSNACRAINSRRRKKRFVRGFRVESIGKDKLRCDGLFSQIDFFRNVIHRVVLVLDIRFVHGHDAKS